MRSKLYFKVFLKIKVCIFYEILYTGNSSRVGIIRIPALTFPLPFPIHLLSDKVSKYIFLLTF